MKTGSMIYVVHLIETLGPGGAERLLYTNLKHFDPERVRSTVITVYEHGTHWMKARKRPVPRVHSDKVRVQHVDLLSSQEPPQARNLRQRAPPALQIKRTELAEIFAARFLDRFDMFRRDRRKRIEKRLVALVAEVAHPTMGVNVASVGEVTDTHVQAEATRRRKRRRPRCATRKS